jgi:hypothetical protein
MDPSITTGKVFLWLVSPVVFSAEIMDILRCAELLLAKNKMMRRTHICSNSRAALAALAKSTTTSALVWECMQVLGKQSESNKVTLVRITGHQGIMGNEEADRLAKEAANGVPVSHTTVIPYIVGKKFIKSYSELEHQDRWDACNGCHPSKTLMRYPLPSRANELLALSRVGFRVAVKLVTGHTTLKAPMYKLKTRRVARLLTV